VPFKDPNAVGSIGFCDANGNQITSGSIYDYPMTWTAVSTIPAPARYNVKGARAVLDAFQPRQGLAPSTWASKQMTGYSTFTNNAHPMVQATTRDNSLGDYLGAFDAVWDGLVQFRIYYGAPNTPPHTFPYPAVTVKVTGDTWTALDAGKVDCTSGTARSAEQDVLPSSAFPKPTSGPGVKTPAGHSGGPGTSAASSGSESRPGTPSVSSSNGVGEGSGSTSPSGTGAATDGSQPSSSPVAATSHSSSSSGWIAGIVAALAVLAGAGTYFWRRRASR
jgi:hypothetical protein